MASGDEAALLDLRLAEFDVLLGNRIVLLHDQLLGHGARILLGHIIEAGVGARHELDLDGGGPGHFEPLWRIWPDPTGQAPKVKENGAKSIPLIPAKAGIQSNKLGQAYLALDSRFRGNERSGLYSSARTKRLFSMR